MSEPAQPTPSQSPVFTRAMEAGEEIAFLALSMLAGMAVLMLATAVGAIPEGVVGGGVIAGPLFIGTAVAVYVLVERKLSPLELPRSAAALGEPKSVAQSSLIVVACVLLALLGSVALGWLQQHLFSTEVEEQAGILALVERRDPLELGLLALSAVVLAPLTEEALFRYMFFRRLLGRAGPWAAWLLPALAFGLSHGNSVGLITYVWLGSVFAFAYSSSGRLWVGMLTHAGHNAVVLALLLWPPEQLPPPP